jgi:hypothetical protein
MEDHSQPVQPQKRVHIASDPSLKETALKLRQQEGERLV